MASSASAVNAPAVPRARAPEPLGNGAEKMEGGVKPAGCGAPAATGAVGRGRGAASTGWACGAVGIGAVSRVGPTAGCGARRCGTREPPKTPLDACAEVGRGAGFGNHRVGLCDLGTGDQHGAAFRNLAAAGNLCGHLVSTLAADGRIQG